MPASPKVTKKSHKKGRKQFAAPKVPGVCSDFGCKSKQAVQAELIERVIKDKAKVELELSKLKADVDNELEAILKSLG